MNEEHIRQLLDAFYSGSASAEQEEQLRGFFASLADVPEEFKADAAMFRAMQQVSDSTGNVPADLEERILDATVRRPSGSRIRRLLLPIIGAAAAVALILAIGLRPDAAPTLGEQSELADANYREVTDPSEAEAISRMLARKLTRTAPTAKRSIARIEVATVKLRESMILIDNIETLNIKAL